MARTQGSRNRGYGEKRHTLAYSMARHLLREDGEPATLRDLSLAAGVTQPTLKHYFGDRDGVVSAVMEAVHREMAPHLVQLGDLGGRSLEESLRVCLEGLVFAWRRVGFGHLFSSGLAVSLERLRLGQTFVEHVLEPVLQAIEHRLQQHAERGELALVSARHAALSLVSPIFLALLHQDGLGGAKYRSLDMDALLREHLRLLLDGLRRR